MKYQEIMRKCLKVIFLIFWGIPSQPGSLCNMREIIRRLQVDKMAKVFNTADEFVLHALKAHLQAHICHLLGLKSPSDPIPHPKSKQWLHDPAQRIALSALKHQKDLIDPVNNLHLQFLHQSLLYVDLREAVRWEDGPHIFRHCKLWLPKFTATGWKNYAAECIHMLAHLYADFPKHISYIAIHNKTINTEGKPGREKPLDQMMEHYNLVVKQALKSSMGSLTQKHIEDVSMCGLFFMEAAKKKKNDREFQCHQSSAHTTRDAEKDINKLAEHLLHKKVTAHSSNRDIPAFKDPTDAGYKKLCNTPWVQEILSKAETERWT